VPGPNDVDPYHAPLAFPINVPTASLSPVTLEVAFPISAPHQSRSQFLLKNDPATGEHSPNIPSAPELFSQSTPKQTGAGDTQRANPIIVPTRTSYDDPSYLDNPAEPNPLKRNWRSVIGNVPTAANDPNLSLPDQGAVPGVRLAWEEPQVYQDQDWTVTFEGTLPGTNGIVADVSTTDGYQTLMLTSPQAQFCKLGVSDYDLGKLRAASLLDAMKAANIPAPSVPLDRRTVDYIQLTDEILDSNDP
jgi:hypothetical protein